MLSADLLDQVNALDAEDRAALRDHLSRVDDAESQAWYWTPEWQEMEREADKAIAEGRITRESPEAFIASFGA